MGLVLTIKAGPPCLCEFPFGGFPSSPKSQGDFPRREASEEEGDDRQFRRECQVPDLGCEFASCSQQVAQAGLWAVPEGERLDHHMGT